MESANAFGWPCYDHRVMPTYDYRCPNGHTFELFQRMSDPMPDGCAVCGASPVERVLYPVAVHFKGSGFYSTDYGRGNSKREGAKEKEGAATGEPGAKKEEKAVSASTSKDD
jgi:putative FmdB family regulatory protein